MHKPPYKVNRKHDGTRMRYFIHTKGMTFTAARYDNGWYVLAKDVYFRTLRDAIISCVYNV